MLWFGVNWSWVLFTDSAKLAGSKQVGGIVSIGIFALVVTISVLLCRKFFAVAKSITERHQKYVSMALLVPLFALLDVLISWFTTIIWLGPQGSIDNITPVSSPTLLLMHTPLKFAARIVGFFGFSALVWTSLYMASNKKLRKLLPQFLLVIIIITGLGWGIYRHPTGEQYKVVAVNETLGKPIDTFSAEDAKLVVFPEYGFDDIADNSIGSRIDETNSRVSFIGSKQIFMPDLTGHINRMFVGNTKDGVINTQDKHRLIPNGEDASYAGRFLLHLTGQKTALDYFSISRQVIKGKEPLRPVTVDTNVLGSGICSSITAPQDYRKLTKAGATILTNSASLDIFNGSSVFAWQQKSLAMFMAVSNARPFVQSANNSESFIMDANGKVLAETKNPGVLRASVLPNTRHTLYTLAGEWLVIIGLGVVAFELGQGLKKGKNRS